MADNTNNTATSNITASERTIEKSLIALQFTENPIVEPATAPTAMLSEKPAVEPKAVNNTEDDIAGSSVAVWLRALSQTKGDAAIPTVKNAAIKPPVDEMPGSSVPVRSRAISHTTKKAIQRSLFMILNVPAENYVVPVFKLPNVAYARFQYVEELKRRKFTLTADKKALRVVRSKVNLTEKLINVTYRQYSSRNAEELAALAEQKIYKDGLLNQVRRLETKTRDNRRIPTKAKPTDASTAKVPPKE